ncbi:hypothetical protein QVD17_27875 [Tagetes erecta]|uniref:Uncharacterized protein n=1 Tax=Tagetes erecta TaxID=13708 RepID=A0AAD8NRK5_TARER|nr:hypothetical protein QVD17_27875 [Tagetes erecta]
MNFLHVIFASSATTLLLIVLAFLSLILRIFIGKSIKNPQYAPVIGTVIHKLIYFNKLHDYFTDAAFKHPTFRLLAPDQSELYTTDIRNIEHILKTNFDNYSKGEGNKDVLTDLFGNGIFAVDGAMWKQQRKLASFEFSTRVLRDFSCSVFRKNAAKLVGIVSKFSETNEVFDVQNEKEDILSRFLIESKKDAQMNDQYLMDIILNFLLAGKDSTANTLSWFFYMLCKNPLVQEKVVSEIEKVMGNQENGSTVEDFVEKINDQVLEKMHYLHAILTETLRLYPAVPVDGRVADMDDTLPDGFKLKKGVGVYYVSYAMGRMPYIWGDDAYDFKPERWLNDDGVFQPESPFKFIAFHAGPRICLGRDFAYRQMKIVSMALLHFFVFKLADESRKVTYRTMFTLHINGEFSPKLVVCCANLHRNLETINILSYLLFFHILLTMAETIASALLGVVVEKLTDEALKKFARSQKIHSELDELQITLRQIQALLNDASHKEISDESVGLWLNGLQHLAYDIDDVLDDVAAEAMHHELTPESGAITSKVRKLIVPTCCTKFSLTHRLLPKLDGIKKKLQNLENQKGDLGLIVKDEKQKNTNKRGNETSLLEFDVVGREGEKEKLINKLLESDQSSKENFSILPIVGMGGVGKTTLARLLYNDTKVKGRFELCAWVCVSDDFDISKITKTIYRALSGENKQFEDLNQLQVALEEKIKGKQFLLVVDDVWNENYDEWEILVRPFHSCAPKSRIIITTRKEQLLKKLGFDHLGHLESLSNKDGLSLLALHALGVDNFDSHLALKPKGQAIVGKCGGLPLALKAIGRLLRTKINEEDWDDVLNSEIWNLENGNEIVPALRLSYQDLSANLKQLFAYCSLFPKDFLFDKEDLVLLWMAEGYLNQSPKNKPLEELGHEYFEKLLSRSFFQYAPNDKSFFVMHDLMNDLAKFVAGEYFLRFENQTETMEESLPKYRHMSFIREEYVGFQKLGAFKRARSLRTLFSVFVGVEQSWDEFYLSGKILDDLIPRLLLLRVLSLSRFNISDVPEFIGNLKHLRYLNLSQTKIKVIPENVGNLYNLQTLILFGCQSLTRLPKSFIKLNKLRHFDIKDTPLLKKLPMGIGELGSLRTLSKIIIRRNDGFAITELKGLQNIHGELSFEGLHNVQSARHAHEANFAGMGGLVNH